MKQCLVCEATFSSSETRCYACGISHDILDGFPAYSPAAAVEGSGFKSSQFEGLANREAKNFWFRVRNRIIIWALRRYCPDFNSFLEIGCGTGFVLSGITKAYPDVHLHGSELFIKGLSFAARRLPSANLMQMDARHIPFVTEFDSIGAFDVLEHIQEDTDVLRQIHKALKPKGIVILTVPQHQWLWSPVDDDACHVRRYSSKELHTKLQTTGFKIIRSTSFVSSLLPAMCFSRFLQTLKRKNAKPTEGLDISVGLNFLFERMLNLDARLIRAGINLPLGGSRLVVAQKIEEV